MIASRLGSRRQLNKVGGGVTTMAQRRHVGTTAVLHSNKSYSSARATTLALLLAFLVGGSVLGILAVPAQIGDDFVPWMEVCCERRRRLMLLGILVNKWPKSSGELGPLETLHLEPGKVLGKPLHDSFTSLTNLFFLFLLLLAGRLHRRQRGQPKGGLPALPRRRGVGRAEGGTRHGGCRRASKSSP